jgi:serine phosphatase RsbU (regulator of sigma subunit)
VKLFLRRVLFFSFCCLTNNFFLAQQRQIDSLTHIIPLAGESEKKVNALNVLAKMLSSNDPNSSIHYAQQALSLSNKLNYQQGKYECYRNMGVGYMFKTEFNKSMLFLDSSSIIADLLKSQKLKAEALINTGSANLNFGKLDKALSSYFSAIKLFQNLNDSSSLTRCYNNIGNTFYYLGNIDEALNYYRQAEAMGKKRNDKVLLVKIYNGLGVIFTTKKNLVKAIEYFKLAEKANNEVGDKLSTAGILNNIAAIYLEQKKYSDAILFYFKYGEISREVGDKKGMANSYGSLGECYREMGDYENALNYFDKQLVLADSFNVTKQKMMAYFGISEVYQAKNDYKSAIKYYRKYVSFKDSASNQTMNLNIAKITAKLENEKADREKELKQEKAEAEHMAEIKKQKIIIWSVIIALVLSFLLIYFVFRNFSQKKKANILLSHKNKIIEEKNKDITDSITYAKRIQEAILPPEHFVNKFLPESFILYKPKDIVAGDFYWMEVFPAGEDLGVANILIAAADCTGHGVPGAMVSVVCSNALNRCVKEFGITDPGKILDKTRELVLDTFAKSDKDVKDGMDISLVSIHRAPNSEHTTLKWAGANNPLWFAQDKNFIEINSNKQPIGKTDNPLPFTTHTIRLNKGDLVYLFTDGYADQFGGPNGKKFKYKQFKETLASILNLSMREQSRMLNKKFEEWRGDLEQVDDVCIIGIKI